MSDLNHKSDFCSEIEIFLLEYYHQTFKFLKCDLFDEPLNLIFFPEKNIVLHLIEVKLLNQKSVPFESCRLLSDHYNKLGFGIIHLWEDVWRSNTHLTSMRLLAQLGISKSIHGRLTKVVQLNKTAADFFLNQHHLQKSASAYYKYGLNFKEELVAVATFSKGRNMTYETVPYRSFELVRFASKAGTTVTGGLSKLIQHFIKEINPDHLMTYADRDWSNGNVYEKLGFKLTETTIPQKFWIDVKKFKRYYPDKIPNNLYDDFELQSELNLEDYLAQHYIYKICNAGNKKYILDLRGLKAK